MLAEIAINEMCGRSILPPTIVTTASEERLWSRNSPLNTSKTRYDGSFDAAIYLHSAEQELRKSVEIKKVIFNKPATIVYWGDGTKTVVKCTDGDVYSEETGLAIAICKKLYGNKNEFRKIFKKWVKNR